jgi:hypothetical protein
MHYFIAIIIALLLLLQAEPVENWKCVMPKDCEYMGVSEIDEMTGFADVILTYKTPIGAHYTVCKSFFPNFQLDTNMLNSCSYEDI